MFTADNDYDIYGTLESVNTWREKWTYTSNELYAAK